MKTVKEGDEEEIVEVDDFEYWLYALNLWCNTQSKRKGAANAIPTEKEAVELYGALLEFVEMQFGLKSKTKGGELNYDYEEYVELVSQQIVKAGANKLAKRLQDELGNEVTVNVRKPDVSRYSDDAVAAFQIVSEHLYRGKKKELGLKIKEISDSVYAAEGFNRRKLKRRTVKESLVKGFLGSEGRNVLGVKSSRKDVDDFNLAIKLYVEGGIKAANHMEFNYRIKQIIDTPIRFNVKYGEKNTIRQLEFRSPKTKLFKSIFPPFKVFLSMSMQVF